jgi:hypothetical protein
MAQVRDTFDWSGVPGNSEELGTTTYGTGHTGTYTGGPWVKRAGAGNSLSVRHGQSCCWGGNDGATVYVLSGSTIGADQIAHSYITFKDTNFALGLGPVVRASPSGQFDCYAARLQDNATVRLDRFINGVGTQLGSNTSIGGSLVADTQYKVSLRATAEGADVRLRVYVNDVEIAGLAYLDNSGSKITAAGKPGQLTGGQYQLADGGFVLTEFMAEDFSSGSSINLSMVERNSITRGLNRGLS